MKIKKIKYRNFRNFGKEGEISFDTNGKMTIIYGTNGDGKTTLHQLFQWILYGRVQFNKTTSTQKLYNLQNGSIISVDSYFLVWGEIEFEHDDCEYSVHREWAYYKKNKTSIMRKTDKDSFTVLKRTSSYDWVQVSDPEALIEQVLPSGLSPYFFFDGETMIADLKVRGKDSAKSLKTALYSIFDLTMYQKALNDLGSVNKKTTVLGGLDSHRLHELEKSNKLGDANRFAKDIRYYKTHLDEIYTKLESDEKRKEELSDRQRTLSELIGNSLSRQVHEQHRKAFEKSIENYNEEINEERRRFGKDIEDNYAYLLISSVASDAGKRMYLKVQDEEKKVISGLTKELLRSLLRSNNGSCICGNKIGTREKANLLEWYSYFPPNSYKATYDRFERNAARFTREFDEQRLQKYLRNIYKKYANIAAAKGEIASIDEELKKSEDIEDLVLERSHNESELGKIDSEIKELSGKKNNFERQMTLREKKLKEISNISSDAQKYENQIRIVEEVVSRLKNEMAFQTKEYSRMLEKEIQYLVEQMLTSKRIVELTEDFQLLVKDSYEDESKSEGQFAVISFAYIGGILKVLKEHEKLKEKEYPLILDGPFSKLDPVQKKNVLDTIPQYAPQIILFSKDPLEEAINSGKVGKIWTIVSNDEKNYAEVKEGNLWD